MEGKISLQKVEAQDFPGVKKVGRAVRQKKHWSDREASTSLEFGEGKGSSKDAARD